MDQQEVEFQRFLQKLEFSDAVWKQLVAQKNLDSQDQCPGSEINSQFKTIGQQLNQGLPKST